MGWKLSALIYSRITIGAALTCALLTGFSRHAGAQLGFPITKTLTFAETNNNYLDLQVGLAGTISGAFNLFTTPTNPTDPSNSILSTANLQGTNLYVRVDGGGIGTSTGFDFRFGDTTTGTWITVPTSTTDKRILASWQTGIVSVKTIGGTIIKQNPLIQIDLVASFVHDTVRFAFTVENLDPNNPHDVRLAFTEDISQPSSLLGTTTLSASPLRLPPNQPNLRTETFLGTAPAYYEILSQLAAATATTPALVHSIRGTLLPPTNQGSRNTPEPTTPSSVAFGRVSILNGFALSVPGASVFAPDLIWNFTPNTKIDFSGSVPSAVTVFWPSHNFAPQEAVPQYVTFVGQSTTENDFNAPYTLDVSAPSALDYIVDRTNSAAPVCSSTPTPFTITAYATNRTNLNSTDGGIDLGEVRFTLTLPKGLSLAAPGDSLQRILPNVAPGTEGSVSWQVVASTQTPGGLQQSGTLSFIVTEATGLAGGGKAIQRSIQVPSPPAFLLPGQSTTQGQFTMFSMPYGLGGKPFSTILGPAFFTNGGSTPLFELVRYVPGPGNAHYEEATTTEQGRGYWVRSNRNTDTSVKVDCAQYQPLPAQAQGSKQSYSIKFLRGWNQIANPYIYKIRFSDVHILDSSDSNPNPFDAIPSTVAADALHQLISPVAWTYDTSDANPVNWQYGPLELGFEMEPFKSYWLFFNKELQVVYPSLDVPGTTISRAIAGVKGVPVGLTRRVVGSAQNWTARIFARPASGAGGTDSIYLGISSKASDDFDMYKYLKPPAASAQIAVSILHPEWKKGDVALDVRSASLTRKIWNIQVTSGRPNQDIDLSWPDLVATLPRNLRLRLINPATGDSKLLRSVSSYRVQTGADSVAHLQIVADNEGHGPALITSFDIVSGVTRAPGEPPTVTFHYALSRAAQTQVTIRGSHGQLARTLIPSATAADGANETRGALVWDLRDQANNLLRRGIYTIELQALTTDGQHTRVVKTYIVN